MYRSELYRRMETSTRARAMATMVGLVLAVAVVSVAARAPLSRAAAVNARAAQAPTTALFMVLAGMGVVMVGGLVLLLWSGRRRKDDPPEREPTKIDVHWIWKLVAMLIPFALAAALVVAAVLGTRQAHQAPRLGGQSFGSGGSRLTGSSATRGGFTLPAWLPWTLLAIAGIALAAGVAVLWLRRWRPAMAAPEVSAPHAAVEAAIDALDTEADPRRAVIAAYSAMQRSLGERGIVRSPAEAPREYLNRALMVTHGTERDARTLTDLFEEARYSLHPIPERFRELALSALRSLQRRLQAEGVR
jgi:hypothetical protein